MRTLKELRIAAERRHEEVCDLHFDHTVMTRDGICRECADDYHEALIMRRPIKKCVK